MTLKENSKAYAVFLVSMLLYGAYSLVLTLLSVVENVGISYAGADYIFNIMSAIIGRFPIVILCVMFVKAGKDAEKCLNALSVYFALCIASVLLMFATNIIGWGTIGDFGALRTRIISIVLNVLAIMGIKVIKDKKQTLFFEIVWLIAIVYNIFIEASYTIATARVFLSYLYTGYEAMFITTLVTTVLYTFFNISLYIFIKNIDMSGEQTYVAEYTEMNIAKCVLLSIITFGIYNWVWLYSISKNIKHLKGDNTSSVGELLCLMFVPLYFVFWIYAKSNEIKTQASTRQIAIADNSVLYLILSLLGVNLIVIALVQSDLNVILRRERN